MSLLKTLCRWAGLAALTAALAACSLLSPSVDPGKAGDNLDKLYADARDDLNTGSFDKAIKTLERIEARATGTVMGQQALLDMAYAQWRMGERTSSLATVDRFIKMHPSSPAFDYALYLKGLVNFNDNMGLLGGLARQSPAERDQRASRDAYQAFSQLVAQYPDSKYAPDAKARMDYIVNALAEYEVHVARYYLRRGAYLAAANRARQAVTEFERAPAIEEALAIMVQSYDRLELKDLRDASERVLRRNFPTSRFLQVGDSSAPVGRSWWKFW